MIRRIIKINEDLCNGCGACAAACHEGAIGMVDGKARLLKDDYCDGLGDCLPTCPTGAITFEEREAAAYDEAAVKARMAPALPPVSPPMSPLPPFPHLKHLITADVREAGPGALPGKQGKTLSPQNPFPRKKPFPWRAGCPSGLCKLNWLLSRPPILRMPVF